MRVLLGMRRVYKKHTLQHADTEGGKVFASCGTNSVCTGHSYCTPGLLTGRMLAHVDRYKTGGTSMNTVRQKLLACVRVRQSAVANALPGCYRCYCLLCCLITVIETHHAAPPGAGWEGVGLRGVKLAVLRTSKPDAGLADRQHVAASRHLRKLRIQFFFELIKTLPNPLRHCSHTASMTGELPTLFPPSSEMTRKLYIARTLQHFFSLGSSTMAFAGLNSVSAGHSNDVPGWLTGATSAQ